MQLDRYAALSDSRHEFYEFTSSGQRGTVKKVVIYERLKAGIYNLAFGDWDEKTQRLIDDTRTNNGDRDKVLATVAHTVIDFMHHHPEAMLYAKGITDAKTRLYQMGINANWPEICQLFDIKGFVDGQWAPFENGKNYDAFTLEAK